ncbi:terminase large subunit domain-containing protein [Paenactinomyces guangxiensis]|uniref:Terminase large subunit gp17-like C-terminal domain-containing protein n=1 Tax=Paenactinomyces guangxiensis TaxID=1490290 RepID=A0A7W2A9F0_9BACL|nr:terminase family protein [Paenactinomyces guangxiensis]MBA4495107.1 hypothetical protein [Paenactinomyces guangxiensis]MBH8592209.1 hypothetical protein [Paenactinomyces guangxiensis]
MSQAYKIKLYRPHPGQIPMHQSTARFRVATCGRRFGKSFMAANEIVKHAWENPNHLCWWTAPTYKQCRNIYELVKRHFKGAIKSFRESPVMEINFLSGGKIQFHSLEKFDNLRGFAVNFLVVDEAADVKEEAWTAVLRPTLSDTNGRAIIISTPKGKNWFYHIWTRGQDPEFLQYESWRFPTSANPYIAPQEIEEAKASIPSDIFRQEYEAEFLDDAAGVFRGIRQCVKGSFEEPEPGRAYVLGLDVAKTTDFTVLTCVDVKTGHVVAWERFNKLDYTLQMDRVETTARKFNNAKILMDSTGVGDPLLEMAVRRGLDVEGYTLTNVTKQHLIEHLAVRIERQEISYPDIPVLLNELDMFQYEITRAGNIRYNAPEGQHDDSVISLALAVWARKDYGPLLIPVDLEEKKTPIYENERAERFARLFDDED